MRNRPRKRRTREHIIADLSVNHVEKHALLCGHVIVRIVHDYGIDLELVTFNRRGETEPGNVLLQLKATDRYKRGPKIDVLSTRIERADLVSWLSEPMPVILVLYNAQEDSAHWVYVQRYFHELADFNIFSAGKTITVRIPTTHVVNADAIRQFADYRDRILRKMEGVSHGQNEVDFL
jgi:hypothetical protein